MFSLTGILIITRLDSELAHGGCGLAKRSAPRQRLEGQSKFGAICPVAMFLIDGPRYFLESRAPEPPKIPCMRALMVLVYVGNAPHIPPLSHGCPCSLEVSCHAGLSRCVKGSVTEHVKHLVTGADQADE